VTRRLAWIATILLVAAGCDKARAAGRHEAKAPVVTPGAELDLASHPNILFEVFGEANDPRMIPIAAIGSAGGVGVASLKRIELTAAGWKRLDAQYLRSNMPYAIFQDGRQTGKVFVRRGMWQGDDPLYSLPGCQLLTPMAAVKLDAAPPRTAFTVEYLASNSTLGHQRNVKPMPPADVERVARAIATQAATSVGIAAHTLDSLDFHAVAFQSGTSPWPTIVAAFIDPAAENPASTHATTTHLLVIADRDSTATFYHTTYLHRVRGRLSTSTFRRFFDHLDVNGDGVDEIFLEGWQFGGDAYLSVLGWNDGKWAQVYRTRAKWCLDG
jgi:hypothetical protein